MTKPPLLITGMFGIGDNIQQRAILRELMKSHEVWLETYYVSMYHDLIAQGLKLKLLPAKVYTRTLEPDYGKHVFPPPPANADRRRITYQPADVRRLGSILAAQFASAGLTMPARPDFSLPVPQAWRDKARKLIASWKTGGKPLMVYRPICLNTVWQCASRSPDPESYASLFQAIRERYFVVSLATLSPGKEWIVGPEQDADIKLHKGELDFQTMAALFAEADLAFVNPGFAPVLALAVGTPNVTVYGGHESSKTTQAVSAHLAPSLAIDPDRPCDCHNNGHACDKTITL